MEGRVCAVFVVVQFLGGSIDILDFFHRAWNVELLRNAAAVPTGCLLRFPLLRMNAHHAPGTTAIGSGVVASLHTSGALRVATSGSIQHALAIADFVYAYVARRLPPAYTAHGATKSMTFFQIVLYPAVTQRAFKSRTTATSKKMGKKMQQEEVDTSEIGAQWLRDRIAACTATINNNHHPYTTSTTGVGEVKANSSNNEGYTHWWRFVTDISVSPLQYRHTLRIVCNFKTPPASCAAQRANLTDTSEHDANAFFFGSELMSVVPLGSVFVAAPQGSARNNGGDSPGGRKRVRHGDEMGISPHDRALSLEQTVEDRTTITGEASNMEAKETTAVPSVCPLVQKPQVKVEALVYRTGRVFVTSDSVEALSFVVEQVLLPLFRKDHVEVNE